jgi:hypothetical protein
MYVAPGLEVQEIGRELLALLYVPRVTVGEAVPAPRNCLRDSFIPDILLGMFVPGALTYCPPLKWSDKLEELANSFMIFFKLNGPAVERTIYTTR